MLESVETQLGVTKAADAPSLEMGLLSPFTSAHL